MAQTQAQDCSYFEYNVEDSYLAWSSKLPETFTSEWLDYWYSTFIALPSFVPCTIQDCLAETQNKCNDETDNASVFYHSLSTLLESKFPPGAAASIERWLVHDLIKAVYGQNIEIPRIVCQVGGKLQHFYRYSHLRQWLPLQARAWFQRLKHHSVEEISLQYIDVCRCYNVARAEFLNLYSAVVKLANRDNQDHVSQFNLPKTSTLWRWILLFQIVGEHVGFVLKSFPRIILHYLGHPPGGYGHDNEILFLEQQKQLCVDWRSNEGLEKLLSNYVDRCPSEIPYISSWSNGLMSNLQLQLENSINLASGPSYGTTRRPYTYMHTDCSEAGCNRPVLSDEDYVQQHTTPNCQCASRRSDRSAIVAALDDNKIPLILIDNSNSDVSLRVIQYQEGMHFVAISHVWSDGRGSLPGLQGNSLPLCQLKFLHSRCHLTRGKTRLPLWMDTLCIPNDKRTAAKKYRPKAIAMMNQVYMKATEVSVVCNDLLHLDIAINPIVGPAGSLLTIEHNIDFWAAIWTSSWMRRCWTFQEGVFGGNKLIFLFRDAAVSIRDVLLPPYTPESPLYEYFLRVPYVFPKVRNWTDRNEDVSIIEQILQENRWRSTKHLEDTVTIFAGILGLEVERIARVDYNSEGCMTERLAMVFGMVGRFPTSVLYSRVPRMNAVNRRWAPQTFHIPDLVTALEISDPGPSLSSSYEGNVSREGLQMWAYLIVVRRSSTKEDLPWEFMVSLDMCLKGPKQAVPLSLAVSRFEALEVPGPRGIIASPVPRATSQYFAVVMRTFHLEFAQNQDFRTDAFIVDLDDSDSSLDQLKAMWNNQCRSGILSWIRRLAGWPTALRGKYLCAARVRAAVRQERESPVASRPHTTGVPKQPTSPDKEKGKAKSSSSSISQTDLDTAPLLRSAEVSTGHLRRRGVFSGNDQVLLESTSGYEMSVIASCEEMCEEPECFEGIYSGDLLEIVIG